MTVGVEVRVAEEHVLGHAETRNVLTFVEPITELRLPTTVQSTSVSASCRDGVWLLSWIWSGCGDVSRSQRMPYVLPALSW